MSFTSDNRQYGEYKHKLSVSEMPSHRHGTNDGWDGYSAIDYRIGKSIKFTTLMTNKNISTDSIYQNDSTVTNSVGGSQSHNVNSIHTNGSGGNIPHNNVQPYLVVFFWRRVK